MSASAVAEQKLSFDEYIEMMEKSVDSRVRMLKELDNRLRMAIIRNEDDILSAYDIIDAVNVKYVAPAFEYMYWRVSSNTTSHVVEKRLRFYLSKLLFAVAWLNPNRLEEHVTANASDAIEIIRIFKTGQNIKQLMSIMPLSKIMMLASQAVTDVIKVGRIRKDIMLAVLDHAFAAVATPIANTVLSNTISWYAYGTMDCQRIGIFSGLGAGKTSLSFYSVYVALRTLGIPEDDALKYTWAMLVNDKLEFIKLAKALTVKKIFTPAIIADDIATMASKYFMLESRGSRKSTINILRTLKIIRELVGAVLLPTDSKSSLAKDLESSIEQSVEGEKIRRKFTTATLWLSKGKATKLSNRWLKKSIRKKENVDIIIGTVHPPMLIPSSIYNMLTDKKLKIRSMWLEDAERSIRNEIINQKGKGNKKHQR